MAKSRQLTGNEDFNGLSRSEPTLPASWYFDPEWYGRELEKVFGRNWLYLFHTSSIPDPGGYRTVEIGDQNILVLRDSSGELRAFHNTCRHRGSILCTEHRGNLGGKLVTCPYHQWAYAMDGRLVATSSHAEPLGFNKADYPLFPVHLSIWRGGIFICLDDTPPDMEESFERGSDRIENWPLESLQVAHTWSKTMACNWKIFWENFNECLHCPNVHPELCELVPMYGRRTSSYRDDPHCADHADRNDQAYRGGLRDGARTWSSHGQAANYTFPELTAEEIERGQSYFVSLPSVYIAAHVDYVRTVRILPRGPEETDIQVEWLLPSQTISDPDFDIAGIVDFPILVMDQDARASELNQRGIRSRRFEQGVLMPEEHYVKAFQDWVRENMA